MEDRSISELVLPNLIKPELLVLFVGINPGTRSAAVGHHFAGHSNRFWRFLFESGLTPVKYDAFRDRDLLELRYGITNIVARTTPTAAELSTVELREGGALLLELIRIYRPKVAAYLGKVIYLNICGHKDVAWGRQEQAVVEGVVDFLLPNPSGLNRMPIPEQLDYYRDLNRLIKD